MAPPRIRSNDGEEKGPLPMRRAVGPKYLGVPEHQRVGFMQVPSYVRELMGRYEVPVDVYDANTVPGGAAGEFFSASPNNEDGMLIRLAGRERLVPEFDFEYLPGGLPIFREKKPFGQVSPTPSHEASHFVDFITSLVGSKKYQSERPLLRGLYRRYCNRDYDGPRPYGCTNESEFLAELMSAYWNPAMGWSMRTHSPELYHYARAFDNKLKHWPREAGPVPPPPPKDVRENVRTYRRKVAIGAPETFRYYRRPSHRKPETVLSMGWLDVLDTMVELGIPIRPEIAFTWQNDPVSYKMWKDVASGDLDISLPAASEWSPADPKFIYGIRDALGHGDLKEAHRLLELWYKESGAK